MKSAPTADYVNWRFEKDYDVYDHRDNAILGANYLAWLTRKMGDSHFASDYRLDVCNVRALRTECVCLDS